LACTAACSVVKGFCTAVAWIPFDCSRAITSDQHDPSANRPCTRTTFRTCGIGCALAVRRRRGIAAPTSIMLMKLRLSIGLVLTLVPARQPPIAGAVGLPWMIS